MKSFSYPKLNPCHFNGELFYQKYKGAEFLKDKRNIQNILCMTDELKGFVDNLKPGESFEMEGMFLKGSPLIITKSGRVDERDVDIEVFTARRLSGLAAAYVLDNFKEFTDIYSSEAEDLGLSWSRDDRYQHVIYLSAVSGAEYFVKHFYWVSLVSGLKKYQLKIITKERLQDIMKVRLDTGERMSTGLIKINRKKICNEGNEVDIKRRANFLTLGGTFDLGEVISLLPEEIRRFFELPPPTDCPKVKPSDG